VTPAFAPMEMRSVDRIPAETGWQYEPKWDGFRCLAHRDGDEVALTSKAGQPLARYFPEIVAALLAVRADRFSLDGELVVPYGDAYHFGVLQQRIHPAASRVAMLAETTPARYLVFDLLREEGTDCVELPLERRRTALERFLAANAAAIERLVLSPATTSHEEAQRWLDDPGETLDGVVAKRLGIPYASGRRDGAVKIKRKRSADCVVGGFRYGKGSTSQIGSLLLGLYDNGLLDYVGFCSAFSTEEKRALLERLRPHIGPPGFTGNAPGDAPSRWSRPDADTSYVALRGDLVLEVEFDQVTSGRIRHGTRPLRWRIDKAPKDCTRDQLG
jgi:ATP-dependent DNA ligase